MPEWLSKLMRINTWCFITSIAALALGVFIVLIPIEILQLHWARWFEVLYFRVLGVAASVTLPGTVTHFILWESNNN